MRPENQAAEIEANERGLLAAMAYDQSLIHEASLLVGPADFSDAARREFFLLLVSMSEAGRAVSDFHALSTAAQQAGLIERLGGSARFAHDFLMGMAGTPGNFRFYASGIRAAALQRKLASLAESLAERANGPTESAAESIQWAEAQLAALQSEASPSDRGSRIKAATQRVASQIRSTLESGTTPGVPVGLDCIDSAYGGFQPGSLNVLAARPSCGKSAMAWQIAESVAAMGNPVLFVSLEMSTDELVARSLAARLRINGKRITNHSLEWDELDRIDRESERMVDDPLTILEPTGKAATFPAIRAAARLHRATHGLSMLVVDYCQILEREHPKQSDYEKVTAATKAAKSLARELKIPVLMLSQLNRESDKSNREPRLADLRDSGAIEQDADNVLMLHRPQPEGEETLLLVRKWRGGDRGSFSLRFDGKHTRFESFAEPQEWIG